MTAALEMFEMDIPDVKTDPTCYPDPTIRLPKQMPAVVYDHYGDADVLYATSVSTPVPDAEKVMIRVQAVGLNPIDYRLRRGEMRFLLMGHFPRIPGFDVAGEVVFAPAESGFRPGDRVMAFLDSPFGGASAHYAQCRVSSAANIPPQLPYEEAAAIPLAASTALQSLRDYGVLKAGERVLINGATGGVGGFAVQIAKLLEADVTAVASGRNRDHALDLGADHFIDYQETDFTSSRDTWDVIFDVAGKSSYRGCKASLREGGRYVTTEPNLRNFATRLVTKVLNKQGTVMLAQPHRPDLQQLARWCEEGRLQVTIDRQYPLEEAAEAHRRLEAGVDRGKVVMQTNAPEVR